MTDMRNAVLNSYARWASYDGIPRQVFALSPKSKSEPSFFEVVCGGPADRLPFQRGSQDVKTPKFVLPHQVLGRYKAARKDAERMNNQHAAHADKWDKDPYTDVHEFVEKALHIDTY